MKLTLDFRRSAGWRFELLAASVALALALPLFCGSCSKKSDSLAGSAPAPTPVPESTTAAPTAAPTTVASTFAPATATNATPDLRPLNHALLIWIVHNRRHPASFEEFAANAGIQIPPPPPGKKYIIDSSGLISPVNR